MDNEINKLQWAKMFMDYLANGIDPVRNTDVDAETLHNEQVLSCFRYISDILNKDMQAISFKKRRGKKAVYITKEQMEMLQVTENSNVSEIANEINRVIAENETRNFQPAWINNWLESKGYLCKNATGNRIATDAGKHIGITSIARQLNGNEKYNVNYYNSEAQRFIFNNLEEILSFRYNGNTIINVNYHNVDYPYHLSIIDFLRQNPDKCFIVATGSCETYINKGSYRTALIYKGRTKTLIKNDINTNSANKCILLGIKDAVSEIKRPSDIIILSATSLGFNSPKSRNYQLCRQIIQCLSDKGCNISISVCKGKGDELISLVKSMK